MTAAPSRIVIGVTGHRNLETATCLEERIAGILEAITRLAPSRKGTPVAMAALSPLAEGADRLVAKEILKREGTPLDVVLPMDKDDYSADFGVAGSRSEFEELLSRARSVRCLSPSPSRAEAYASAGRYVVDHCDVLIALWDGKPEEGSGGTAEIVRYARTKRCPLFWIDTNGAGRVVYEEGRGWPGKKSGRRCRSRGR